MPASPSAPTRAYAPIHGLQMYYEIDGRGPPLVYLPPVFGFAGLKAFPALTENHTLIVPDLQGHGRTADLPDRPLSIARHAEDVIGLLDHLGIAQADFFGESYGANTAVTIALHHPERVNRVATYGGTFGPPAVAHNTAMLRFTRPPTPDSASHGYQRERYQQVAPNPAYWPKIWEKVVAMHWEGLSPEQLASIQAPVLIALGDRDFVRLEHAVDTFRRLPHAELAVIPDAGHFALFSEPDRVIPVIQHFLEKPTQRCPVGTGETGYHPGETR